jgi:hypothetical protein
MGLELWYVHCRAKIGSCLPALFPNPSACAVAAEVLINVGHFAKELHYSMRLWDEVTETCMHISQG